MLRRRDELNIKLQRRFRNWRKLASALKETICPLNAGQWL